jgi:hypothetical protein
VSRNKMFFQGLELIPAWVAHKTMCVSEGSWSSTKEKPPRILKEYIIHFEKS